MKKLIDVLENEENLSQVDLSLYDINAVDTKGNNALSLYFLEDNIVLDKKQIDYLIENINISCDNKGKTSLNAAITNLKKVDKKQLNSLMKRTLQNAESNRVLIECFYTSFISTILFQRFNDFNFEEFWSKIDEDNQNTFLKFLNEIYPFFYKKMQIKLIKIDKINLLSIIEDSRDKSKISKI